MTVQPLLPCAPLGLPPYNGEALAVTLAAALAALVLAAVLGGK